MSNEAIMQIRALLDQLEETSPKLPRQTQLPYSDNPRSSMPLSEDGKYFIANWWMEGYVGALAGVKLSAWGAENYAVMGIGGQGSVIPKHYRVLVPNMGQLHVSPADLGWIDASGYDPENYPDGEVRRAEWLKVGCPTVGPRGKFDNTGNYVWPGAWANAIVTP